MSVRLALTDAGRAALADAANRATRAVQFRRLAIGAGTASAGTDAGPRTALRIQREIAAATGSTTVPARIAVRADFAPAASYSVTEVGLFGRIGAAGDEFLVAYWVGEDAGDAIAATAPGAALVVAGIVEIVSSAAEIDVTLSPTIQVGAPGQATTAARGLVELATVAEARTGTDTERAVTPAGLAGRTPDASTAARGLVELATVAEARTGTDTERAVTPAGLAGRTPDASTAARGLVELATVAEARTGTDAERAVTPAGLAGRTPNASTAARGLVELATVAEAQIGADAERAVTPAGARAIALPIVIYTNNAGFALTTTYQSITLPSWWRGHSALLIVGSETSRHYWSVTIPIDLIPATSAAPAAVVAGVHADVAVHLYYSGATLYVRQVNSQGIPHIAERIHRIVGTQWR